MPVAGPSNAPFSGLIRREKPLGGIPVAALSSPFAVVNENSQQANNGTAGNINLWRETFSILRGQTNFRGAAVATNHANVLCFSNPDGYRYLEISHAYSNAIATTMSTVPRVVVLGKAPPVQVNNSRQLRDIDAIVATGFPDPSNETFGVPFSRYGMWAPPVVPGYTPGTPDFDLPNNPYFVDHFDPTDASNTTPTRKIGIDEPVVVYCGGITEILVLVHTAAAFSATTRSLLLARFSTS